MLTEAPWGHQPSPMTSSCAAQGLWETLHKRPKLRSKRGPVMAAVPFCFVAKAPRCTLHSGLNHEESLKAHFIKGGQWSPALMLRGSRQKHEKRMCAGKEAAREKEIPATNKSPSNLS